MVFITFTKHPAQCKCVNCFDICNKRHILTLFFCCITFHWNKSNIGHATIAMWIIKYYIELT